MMREIALMYTILSSVVVVLTAMVVITCLLLHHNKQLYELQTEVYEVKRKQMQQRRLTKGKVIRPQQVDDDGYILPNETSSNLNEPNSPTYIDLAEETYETYGNASHNSHSSGSNHLYESMEKIRA